MVVGVEFRCTCRTCSELHMMCDEFQWPLGIAGKNVSPLRSGKCGMWSSGCHESYDSPMHDAQTCGRCANFVRLFRHGPERGNEALMPRKGSRLLNLCSALRIRTAHRMNKMKTTTLLHIQICAGKMFHSHDFATCAKAGYNRAI